jgi:LuxR family transcriptional regulator, maltose regulon positive regulatory protein
MTELLKTKLYIPRRRPNLVSRPHLTNRLNAGLDKKLTLISAPPGFGKTTLLSEWIPGSPRCVTWLSLDDGDNDPTKFWAYLISSLQGLRPDLGESALDLLQSPQAPAVTSILTALINDITAFPDLFATVLDDYHLIDSMQIHEGLTFLIDHLPKNMHLVITTRIDPPLSLSRLRVQDQLTELRANDLRFKAEECAQFLDQAMGLSVSVEEVAALEGRTEGWIAGLQIAALSMQGRQDLPVYIQAFSGSHRHILGYLAEEVLDRRPTDTLNFLLKTSILDRMCGPLCDAVTGGSGGQVILEELEHANLFLIPLDDEGVWYRYHHLFADVLQARLRQSFPELLSQLHQRASEWYEAQDLLVEAIQYALSAGAMLRAAQLIEKNRWALLGRGEAHTLHRWLDELPRDVLQSKPGLSVAYAWILSLLEEPETIEAHLQDAESAFALKTSPMSQEAVENEDAIRGEIAILRAEIALSRSDIHQAIELCRQALEFLPEGYILMRGVSTYFLGHGERRSGNMVAAEQAYVNASELGLQNDNLLLALYALANLSSTQISMGRLRGAAQTSQRILEITAERQRQTWPLAGLAYQGLGKLYYEWNDLDESIGYLRLGIESGQRGGLISLEINSRAILAFALQAQNNLDGAAEMLRETAYLSERNHHPFFIAQTAAMEARLKLRQGHTEQAVRWARACGLNLENDNIPYTRQVEYLTLARVLITLSKFELAENMLDRLFQAAENDQRTGDMIEILIQQALLLSAAGKRPEAIHFLDRALQWAEPEGYIRIFVDEGDPMRLLLIDYQANLRQNFNLPMNHSSHLLLNYTDRLLAAFSKPSPNGDIKAETLLEPLSERELDILRLIATGRTNQEIAEILVIALSTVKSHINHLYGKVGVHNRVQAISVAREMGLLPE